MTEEIKKAKAAKEVQPPVTYITANDVPYQHNILLRGEDILGFWSSKDQKRLRFVVPSHLVEAMEMHFAFTSGQIVVEPEAQASGKVE